MSVFIDPIEALWFLVTGVALMFNLVALAEARRDLKAALLVEPLLEPRLIVARGNVRREFLRVVVQALLISLVIPSLFSDGAVPLSPFVIILIFVALTLFASSAFDRRDRDKLAALLTELIASEKVTVALESSVQEGIALTREALQAAKAAASAVDEKVVPKVERITSVVEQLVPPQPSGDGQAS